jgi:DNA polymerase-3 subunit beta
MERDELLNLIRIAGLFSSKINDIKISLRAGRLEILSQDPDLGENKSYLEAEIKGKEIETTFNYRYLLEGLINIGTKKVFLGMNSETSPAILKPQEAKENYLYVVMPIRLN